MALPSSISLFPDAGVLYGLSIPSRGDAADADGLLPLTVPFPDADGGNGESPRAMAFSEAVSRLKIKDGAALALPSDCLISRILAIPQTEEDMLSSMVKLRMEKYVPAEEGECAVSYEIVGGTEDSMRVFAAAVPPKVLEGLAEDLEASQLAVTKLDAALLCEWDAYRKDNPLPDDGASALFFALPSGRIDFFLFDAGGPLFARCLGTGLSCEAFARELSLSLLDFASEHAVPISRCRAIDHAQYFGEEASAAVKRVLGAEVDVSAAPNLAPYLLAAARREEAEGTIDLVPPSWRESERSETSSRRFRGMMASALLLWALCTAALFSIPGFIKKETDRISRSIDAIAPQYRKTADIRQRVRLIRSYEDKSRSFLEVFRDVCTVMPDGMVFSSVTFERGNDEYGTGKQPEGGIKITGDAEQSKAILDFKDALDSAPCFTPSKLTGPAMDGKRSRYRFELDSRFAKEEPR